MGVAIRPRQKLGGGTQGKVRIIPSSVKGKRAHPHLVEKILVEGINKKEYQKALASAVSATSRSSSPIILTSEIESVAKTKDMIKIFSSLKLINDINDSKDKVKIRKGLRRSSRMKHYKKTILLIVGKNDKAIKAARNIAGVDACIVSNISANLLAPGGVPGRTTVWSEHAMKGIEESIRKQSLK